MRKVGRTHSWAVAVTSLMAVMIGACGTNGRPDGALLDGPLFVIDATNDLPETPSNCQDNDHDQFGVDCRLGPDCDDEDPTVTDQCYRCASPATGCACTEEGERRACDAITDSTLPGPDGTCHLGARTCTNGQWSRCIALDGSNRTLTGPLPCPGVCDPTCQHYSGCPTSSSDLGSGSSGVMIGDAGAPVWCPMTPGGIVLQPTPGTVTVGGNYCATITCGTNTSCCGSCYTYSNQDRQAPALCGRHSGTALSTGESVCGQACATGTTHCGVAPFDYCCTSTQDCRFGVCVTRGSGACNADSDCPSGQYCNRNLGNSSSYCTPTSPALCSCSSDTLRQGCLSNVVAQGGTIIEDIFRTSDGRDARQLRFARYMRGLASNPTGTCPVGRTNAAPNTDPYPCPSCSPNSCTGGGSTCFNTARDNATISSFANTLDWRWIQEQRTTATNAAVADGDSTNYFPSRSVVYDLRAPSNRVVLFPIVNPAVAGASVGACGGPLAFTVWLSNNPNATAVNTTNTVDPTKWNQARLIGVYTEGWTRNAAATGDPADTTDVTTTAGGAATADGMTTEWQVACGQNFRYVAITAGFQGGGGMMNACSQDRVRNIIDAVAGLDENGRVPGIVRILPFGATAGPDTVSGTVLPNADVYFLVDTSSSMAGALTNVQNAVSTTGEFFPGCESGIMNGVRCVIRDSWFGAGQVQDFPVSPYGASGADSFYIHNRDVTSDMTLVTASLSAFTANGSDTGGSDALEAQVPALWSLATGTGIQAVVITGDGGFMGTTYNYLSDRPACATGSVGYPCFRSGTLPVVVAFTDQSRWHNGPGNVNLYDDYALFGSGAVTYPAAATALDGSDDWSAGTTPTLSGAPAQTISGTTSGFANDNTSGVCGGSGRDVVYQFTLSAASRVHIDTNGTTGSVPVIYVRNAATSVQAGCSAATSTTFATMDIDLAAGTYQLWVDATSNPNSGPYQLHFSINVPPAATLPRWATTVAALNSIGARVITVDTSGSASPNDNTSMANATNAISSGGTAYRFGTDATMSDLASVTVGSESVVQAILTQANANSRMDVYAVAVDNPATATVNESRFVLNPPLTTATTANLPLSATPYTTGVCTGTTGSPAYQANSCLSGNGVNFSVTWVNNIVPMTNVVQTFTFNVIVYGAHGGTVTVLQTIPVTIYVPPQTYPPSGQVTFDLTAPTCPAGQQWQWTQLQFDSDTPPMPRTNNCSDPGTSIRFSVQSAWTSAGLASATPITLGSTPCTASPYNASAALIAGGVSDRLPYLRLTATLNSYNGMTPTLRGYNMLGACVDAL